MNWLKDYSGLIIWLTIRLTIRPTLAVLTARLITRLKLDWRFSLDNSAYNSAYTSAYNSAGNSADNSALQFGFTIQLTFQLYNSAEIQLTIRPYNLADQNGWNDPSVWPATLPWSKAGVSCRGLRWRTLAESDARMGKVTRGKDSFWWYFSVDRFPVMDLSPGPTQATLNRTYWCRWFYTYSRRFTHVYLRVRVYLRAMHFCSRDYFTNFLRLKVLNF